MKELSGLRSSVRSFTAALCVLARAEGSERKVVMEWLQTNWFWVLIGIAFVAMHLVGHGGHGGHGGRDNSERPQGPLASNPDGTPDRRVQANPAGHQH